MAKYYFGRERSVLVSVFANSHKSHRLGTDFGDIQTPCCSAVPIIILIAGWISKMSDLFNDLWDFDPATTQYLRRGVVPREMTSRLTRTTPTLTICNSLAAS